MPRIYNKAGDKRTQQYNKQIISDLHFVSASESKPNLNIDISNRLKIYNKAKVSENEAIDILESAKAEIETIISQ